jgi:hypothetical protein
MIAGVGIGGGKNGLRAVFQEHVAARITGNSYMSNAIMSVEAAQAPRRRACLVIMSKHLTLTVQSDYCCYTSIVLQTDQINAGINMTGGM